MRRYQKWLTVGLLVLTTPGMVLAGSKSAPVSRAQSAASATKSAKPSNQDVANRVSAALGDADLDIKGGEVEFANGTAFVNGQVKSAAEKKAVDAIVRKVPGVQRVQNNVTVASKGVQQAAASQSRTTRKQVRQVADFQEDATDFAPSQHVPPPPNMGHPGYAGAGMAPQGAPAYGPAPAGSNMVYNQPGLPNHSWPTYAQYPNYAAVTYPSQYSAAAWPYIGPFYPYPQVPLGWRKAQLEWDDGSWHLNFSPRTERWWWFLDWRNW